MKINKVVYGGATLLDLTEDTVNEDVIVEGYVGHDASGEQITGKLKLITVDDELDANSTNPIQNNVVVEALNTKADKSTTYTKTEVDDLVANSGGGSSEDCLKTTGGVLNGTDSFPIGALTEDFFNGTSGGQLIGSNFKGAEFQSIGISAFEDVPENLLISPKLQLIGQCDDTLADLSGTAILEGNVSVVAGAFSSVIYGGLVTSITGGDSQLNLGIMGNTLNNIPIPLSVNGINADSDGNIEIPSATTAKAGLMSSADKAKLDGLSGGSGGGDDGYFPSNEYTVMGKYLQTFIDLGEGLSLAGWKVYDPMFENTPPPKYISCINISSQPEIIFIISATEEEILNSIYDIIDCAFGYTPTGYPFRVATIGLGNIFGEAIGMECVRCPNATAKPLWVITGFSGEPATIIPAMGYY